MELTNLIDLYGEQKTKANALYAEYKTLMEEVERTRRSLQIALESTGLRSAKSEKFGVSTVTKVDVFISNEHLAMEWLKDAPNIEADAYIGLKTTAFKKLATEMLKQTGEVADGTEVMQKETISIKANKK